MLPPPPPLPLPPDHHLTARPPLNPIGINIDEEIYQKSLLSCKLCLLGRLSTFKGNSTPKPNILHASISPFFNPAVEWEISPLGKGFFNLTFSSLEDKVKALSISSIKLSFGIFRLFHWKKDFNPSKSFTFAHVWVQIRGLPWEYRCPKILSTIANVIGPPIFISKNSKILVEVNLSNKLHSSILVERRNFSFYVHLEYKNLPNLCIICGCIGHDFSVCKYATVVDLNPTWTATKKIEKQRKGTPAFCSIAIDPSKTELQSSVQSQHNNQPFNHENYVSKNIIDEQKKTLKMQFMQSTNCSVFYVKDTAFPKKFAIFSGGAFVGSRSSSTAESCREVESIFRGVCWRSVP